MRTFNFLLTLLISTSVFAGDLSFSVVFPEFAKLNIAANVEKKESKRFAELGYEQDRYYLSVNLGKISQTQFNSLQAFYGSRSQVSYESTRNYDLSDFLPPSIQAVTNQTFAPIEYSFGALHEATEYDYLQDTDSAVDLWALSKNGLMTQTNCWNTTFENLNAILFNKTTYRLFLPGRWTANDEVDSSSQLIQEKDLQPWDMLIIREKSSVAPDTAMLMHTALFINKNVVFEKTDTSENDPYRLSLVQDVLTKYKEVFGDQLVVEHRRATQPLFNEIPYMNDPIIQEIIKKYHPDVNTNFIASGCETGMGGGCDMYLEAVVPTEIIIYKKTGRGILKGPKNALDRFSPL